MGAGHLIARSIVRGNRGVGVGAGAVATVANCIISNNLDTGVTCAGITTIINNIISGNCSAQRAGGIACNATAGGAMMANNTIFGNVGIDGGGVFIGLGSPTVVNNIIAFNSSGIYCRPGTTPVLRSNCVHNPQGLDYEGVAAGSGDINLDPGLASAVLGRLHIQPGSPCIDAGDDSVLQPGWLDMDSESRLLGAHVDIGADESDGTVWDCHPHVVRVSPDGDDANDGSTWLSAKKSIQQSIDTAGVVGGEVWVKAGTYIERIKMKPYVHIYGGFAGSEQTRDERDWKANASIIEGDPNETTVTTDGAGLMCTLDGLVLQRSGKAVDCRLSLPTIRHCTIKDNGHEGIYCASPSANILENLITGNNGGGIRVSSKSKALISGNLIVSNRGYGGIECTGAAPVILDNNIRNNSGYSGGGIGCSGSSPTIRGNTIVGNTASSTGGGIGCSECSLTIANNMILHNSADSGGGVACTGGAANNVILLNNTIAGNTGNSGGGVYSYGGSSTIINNVIAHNTSGIFRSGAGTVIERNNCVHNPDGYDYSGLTAGEGDISQDPRFVALGYGQTHIQPDSPCVDAGYDPAIQYEWPDIDGQARIQNQHVDIGADESDGTVWTHSPTIIRVAPTGDDSLDGSSWARAKRTVQAAADAASLVGGEVWVAKGTYLEKITLNPLTYVYGGFSGQESSRFQRQCRQHVTILDGGGNGGRVVTVPAGRFSSGIDGFTIRNGNSYNGGGVLCTSASPIISNNIITNNIATIGPGICCSRSQAQVIGNIICSNSGSTQGSLYCSEGSVVITHNTICDNNVGISSSEPTSRISNNIVAFNRDCGISSSLPNTPILRNNCVYNPQVNYKGVSAGTGDIQVDPRFINRSNGNYHLLPTSPCIDMGWSDAPCIPQMDIDGQLRTNGASSDMGTDEYWQVVSVSDAKRQPDGTVVEPSGAVVTASFYNSFYIENEDRTCGVRVDMTLHGQPQGTKVCVTGSVQTNADGERYIAASAVAQIGLGSIAPLALNNSWLGGAAFGLQEGTTNGAGLNTIGLLVTIWGRVLPELTGVDSFTIDDGSGRRIRCLVPNAVTIDPSWTYVGVTGACSCEKVAVGTGSELRAIVRVRTQEDVVAF